MLWDAGEFQVIVPPTSAQQVGGGSSAKHEQRTGVGLKTRFAARKPGQLSLSQRRAQQSPRRASLGLSLHTDVDDHDGEDYTYKDVLLLGI
jgi:hypothetical protein